MPANRLKITYTWVRSQRSLVLVDPEDEGTTNVRKAATSSPTGQNLCLLMPRWRRGTRTHERQLHGTRKHSKD